MSIRAEMLQVARDAKAASLIMATLSSAVKNQLLERMADALEKYADALAHPIPVEVDRAPHLTEGSLDPGPVRAAPCGTAR